MEAEFSGEEEPLAEAQKVKLERTIKVGDLHLLSYRWRKPAQRPKSWVWEDQVHSNSTQ